MRRLLLVVLLAVTAQIVSAQLTISTTMRQDGTWDAATEKWDIFSKDSSGTFFKFNKDLTSFRHTTATITSDYTIIKWDYDEAKTSYTMKVKSDAGNEYDMIIDGVNNCVAFFFYDNKQQYRLVRHTIKETAFLEQ